MNELKPVNTNADAWAALKAFTPARIALGRTGTALPLKEVLDFRMAHAHAQDAVYSLLDIDSLVAQMRSLELSVNLLHSEAANRQVYLQRPDKGRKLDKTSMESLAALGGMNEAVRGAMNEAAVNNNAASVAQSSSPDTIAIVLTDGLSATAINRHALSLLELLIPMLQTADIGLCPVTIVQQGRVAIGDEVGSLQKADLSIVLIGERPGLSSPDSMGIYLTYKPQPGLTDEARNCISNVRPGGLTFEAAADKLFWLIKEALKMQISGVALKDNAGLIT